MVYKKAKDFYRKYKGIKMYKFVPLLENELKETIRRKNEWISTALDYEEKYQEIKSDNKLFLFLHISLLCFLIFLFVSFNVFIIRSFL